MLERAKLWLCRRGWHRPRMARWTGVHAYMECRCGQRTVRGGAALVVDRQWLDGGEWSDGWGSLRDGESTTTERGA